ncbi:MAG: phosphoglycerate kinase [Candidatus Blackburnbacteria bacterium]|nr:phosphoglycerate kinase [Candidatus Blackburnbacteria bacterium]
MFPAKHLEKLLKEELGHEFEHLDMYMAENLRFFPGEEKNDPKLVRELASKGDIYINDAFASCSREHASVVGLPKVLPHAAGFSLIHEVEALSKVLEKREKPVVFVLGGGKGDKALLIPKLLQKADWLLVGGLLPKTVKSYGSEGEGGVCVSAAHLTPKGEDITPDSARNFAEVIKEAGTIVWGGPMGDIDGGYWDGTEVVGKAIAESGAYKVAGGGDTIHAINNLKLTEKFDHISMGGGAMLEFLAYGDLPGLRTLRG